MEVLEDSRRIRSMGDSNVEELAIVPGYLMVNAVFDSD